MKKSVSFERLEQLRTMPYPKYLQSEEWKEKRMVALQRAEFRCQICNSREELRVHHRTYERRGAERMKDLTVLCDVCHGIFHEHGKLTKEQS